MPHPFRDRHDAGRMLGELAARHAGTGVVVLGMARGGMPVAYEVAHRLHAPLDAFLLRPLIVPGVPDVVIGLVASGGVRVLDRAATEAAGIVDVVVEEVTQRERISLLARERTYRGHNNALHLRQRPVLLVDDGSAPESCLRMCVRALREHAPAGIVLAVPCIARGARDALLPHVEDIIAVSVSATEVVPGEWYSEYLPISHTEVRALLALSQAEAQSRELAAADGAGMRQAAASS
jgi:putative phosphoribosyl transferase